MTYELGGNYTNISSFFTVVNNMIGGWFGPGILIIWWWIVFTFSSRFETKRAFTVASWSTALLSGFFYVYGLVTPSHLLVTASMISAAAFWLWISGEE